LAPVWKEQIMGKTVSVDVPHKLGVAEAKRRIQTGLAALKEKYASHLSALEIDWAEDRADFKFGVMGQTVVGALEIFADFVRVSIELPWALALIAEKAKGLIAHRTAEALQLPPPKA
jgi:hypothetical protein